MDDKDAVIQTPENTGAEISMALYKPVDYLQQYRNSHKDMVLTGDDVQRTYTYDPATWKPTQYEKLGFFGKVGAGVSNFTADLIDTPEAIERYALGAGVGMKKTFFPNMKEQEFERLYNNLQTNYTSAQNNRWEYLNEATDGHTGVIEGTEAILNLLEFIGAGYIGAGAGAAAATSPRAAKLLAKGKQIGKITQGRIARGAARGAERAVGALAAEQTGTQIAGEFAQQYAEQTGDTTFQNYNPGKDTLEATGLAILSGIINTKLDVGRLAGGATSKFVSKATTTAGRAGRQLVQAGGQEFVEESIESVTQDVGRLLSDYDYELELDDIVKNAITNGLIGAALGGPAGAGIYYINRSRAIHWYTEKGLKQEQATQVVDEIMDTGRSELLEEINTSAELAMQQGQAFQSLYNAYLGMFNATATEEERFDPAQAETYAKDAPQWRIHNLAYATATQQANIITTHIADNNMPTDLFIQMNEAMDNMLAMRNFTPEEVINRLTQIEQELAHQRELGEAKNADVVAKMKRQKSVLMKVARINQNIEVNRTRYRLRQNAQIDQNTIQENAPQLVGTLEGITQATKGQKFVYVGNTKVPVQYKVVDLKQVKQSHINGIANPEYTNKELQNRSSRSTQADVAVLRDRAKNLRPYELLETYNAQSGAPLTNAKGEVIAGNGRTETIRFAYETNPEAIAEYKQAIKDLGYDIEGMEQPILIRETDMTAEQQLAVADASNISQISAFDHASRAIQDSKLLSDTKDIMDFGNKIPLNERQGLFLNDNTWDMRALEQRYNDAILAWVCGNNANLFQDIVLSNKTPKKVVDAISRAGATAFQMNEAHPELQIQDDLLGALQKLRSVDKKDRFVEVVNQTTIDGKNPFGENMFLYQFEFEDQDTIAGFIGEYARLAEIPTIGLFGEEPLSKYDLMNRAEQAIDAHKQQLAIAADRPYKSKFGENGETLDTNLLAVQMSNTNGNIIQEQTILNQEQFDLADENARLDATEPEYTGETIEDIDGNKRPVYNSDGNRIAKSEKALKNFYRWFGTSKIVDKQGRPIVMYHGTTEKFNSFFADSWIYVTPDKAYAEEYTQDNNFVQHPENVMPVYMNASNPVEIGKIHEELDDAFLETLRKKLHVTKQQIDQLLIDTGNEDYKTVHTGRWEVTNTQEFWDFFMKYTDFDSLITQERENVKGYAAIANTQIKSINNRGTYSFDTGNIYAQRTTANAWYDPELQTIALGARWNEFSIPHEMAHHWLNSFFNIYKQAQQGKITITDAWKQDAERLFAFIGIDTRQSQVTTVQQEKWASMNEAYIAGFVPAELKNNIAYKDFQQWTPQKYKSIMQIGYLDENGNVINPVLTADDIEFFNKWYAHPDFGNIDIHPEGQKWAEPAQNTKAMNNREKTIAQDWQEIETGNQQLDTLRDENTPTELKAQVEAAEVRQKQNASEEVPTLPEHESFLKFGAKDAKARMAEIARNYIKENKEHAYEIAASNPLFTENDTGVDREFLIMAVIEDKGLKPSDPEYAQLMHNAARTRQIAGSTLGLHNESSFRWYIDAMTQIEETLENKAAINYAGRGRYARYKFNQDIEEFVAQRVDKILATAKNSQERNTALSAMFAEATTKFGGNVNDGALTQLDLTGQTATRANKQAFVAWAKAEIKRRAGAGIKPEDQAKLLEVSQKAQQAEAELDSPDKATAIAAAKTLREWQNTVNGFKKTAKGKVGRFFDSVFGEYAPRAMLFSPSTLLANVPGNIINTAAVRIADKVYGASKVDKKAIANEIDRLKAISRSTGMNIATMDKPTSPSLLHGEKYKQTSEAWKWVDPLTYLGETDNLFRISTYTDVLARIATRDAEKQGVSPTELFRAYTKVHQEKGSAGEKARMEAIEIGNIAVFTQNGQLAKMANKIRDALNIVGTGTYGLGNLISPFVKTPANIVEMGARAIAMPFTHWGTILNWKNATTKAKFDFAIDGITLATATIATVLLAALSDDDWYEESYEGGKFDYNKPYDSIKIGGVWIRLDQFGTAMLPIQFGAKLVKELQSNSDWTDTLQKTVWHGFKEGIRQTPVIDTFQDNSLSWASRKPGQYALNWAYNQTNKLVPAWMKQIERPIMRETDIVVTPGTYIGKKFVRNYGLDGTDNTINDWLGIIYGRIKVTK